MSNKVERWEVGLKAQDMGYAILSIEGIKTRVIGRIYDKEDAQLICALHNEAIKINPNPMAVAEGLERVIKAGKAVISATKYMQIEEAHKEEIVKVNELMFALAAINKPATEERL